MLHTSGTSSCPKLVPLTHANLAPSAGSVAHALALQPNDRCLNLMPHIHGLGTALLASLEARGSVACTPGFRHDEIIDWVQQLEPTWYTAAPTIHQSMLRVAEQSGALGSTLRLVRSPSAALPVPVYEALEWVFNAPVIEAHAW